MGEEKKEFQFPDEVYLLVLDDPRRVYDKVEQKFVPWADMKEFNRHAFLSPGHAQFAKTKMKMLGIKGMQIECYKAAD